MTKVNSWLTFVVSLSRRLVFPGALRYLHRRVE